MDSSVVAPVELTAAPAVPPRPRRSWRVRLTGTVCAGWLVFVVAHRVFSGRAYWWGPFDLAPPFVFAVVPAVLILLACLTRRRLLIAFAVSGLILGIDYAGINAAGLWHTRPPAAPGSITVVTWNTQYWDQDLQPGGPHSTEDFYRFLRSLDADVYLLQEYAHIDLTRADTFASALAIDQTDLLRQWFPGYEIVLAGRDLTLSRLPVAGHHWLDSTPWMPEDLRAVPPGLADRPLFYQSQTLRTDILVGGQSGGQIVSFYNSHIFQPPQRIFRLRSDPGRSMFAIDRFNFEIRRASYRAIAADMAGNPNRVVLGGDFNTSPAMNLLQTLPHRLVDQSPALASLYPATWPAGSAKWRLDWLFTTPDVDVSTYDLLDPQGLSDHKAQRVVLSAG